MHIPMFNVSEHILGAVTNAAILAAPLSAVSNTVTSLPSQHTLCKRLGQQSMDQESSETVVGVRIHSLPQVRQTYYFGYVTNNVQYR